MQMEKQIFKKHDIKRTSQQKVRDVQEHKKALANDFQNHCGYCNLDDKLITPLPFQIDHYIPRAEFKDKRGDLETDYQNLIYSCPKCNRAKGKKFKGDVTKSEIDNELFHDPAKVDFNTIFYRDEIGNIKSEDDKGKEMIKTLKLFHPIHNSAWLVEELECTYKSIKRQLLRETNEKRKELLQKAYDMLCHILNEQKDIFRASYYQK